MISGEDLQWFLGIEVIRDRARGLIWLSQTAYIDKIIGLTTSTTTSVTALKAKVLMAIVKLLLYDGQAKPQVTRTYQQKVRSILYAAVITRPDVAFTISRLVRFNTNPSP